MTVGKSQKPMRVPRMLPERLARIAYMRYCITICGCEYPSALSVPI